MAVACACGLVVGALVGVLSSLDVMALVVSGLVIVNTLVISVSQRRREIGILRAVGSGKAQIRSMVTVESAALALFGTLLGIPLGLVIQAIAGRVAATSRGLPIRYVLQAGPPALAVFGSLAVCLVGSSWPARVATRLPVVEAIGYE